MTCFADTIQSTPYDSLREPSTVARQVSLPLPSITSNDVVYDSAPTPVPQSPQYDWHTNLGADANILKQEEEAYSVLHHSLAGGLNNGGAAQAMPVYTKVDKRIFPSSRADANSNDSDRAPTLKPKQIKQVKQTELPYEQPQAQQTELPYEQPQAQAQQQRMQQMQVHPGRTSPERSPVKRTPNVLYETEGAAVARAVRIIIMTTNSFVSCLWPSLRPRMNTRGYRASGDAWALPLLISGPKHAMANDCLSLTMICRCRCAVRL